MQFRSTLATLVAAVAVLLATGCQPSEIGRWQAFRAGDTSVWLVDTTTGEVYVCGVSTGGQGCRGPLERRGPFAPAGRTAVDPGADQAAADAAAAAAEAAKAAGQ